MMASIRSKFHRIVSADDQRRLLIGWIDEDNQEHHLITLSSLRTRNALRMETLYDVDAYNKMCDLIINSNGRIILASFLSCQYEIPEIEKPIDKLGSLKAFW